MIMTFGFSARCAVLAPASPNAQGRPLPRDVADAFGALFAQDFGAVRIHADAPAAAALGARAFACCEDIFFAADEFAPRTPRGRWLLAHELAHVVQQRAGRAARATGARLDREVLEEAASRAADLVAAGRALPRGFALGAAPYGLVQRHEDVPCPGVRVSAANVAVYQPANRAIELAYVAAPANIGHIDAILFGSQFETRDIRLPKGAPNKRFGNFLLDRLRGLRNQRRPDIIDFHERVFYEIKSAEDTRRGSVQIESYYRLAEEIRVAHPELDEPPWKIEYAVWYPPHVLPLPGDVLGRIVCTQATDHSPKGWPGLILYDVRQLPARRRQSARFRLEAFEPNFVDLTSFIRAQLPKTIPTFDPASPDYALIVPKAFFELDYIRNKSSREWDMLRMKMPYFLDTRQSQVAENRIVWMIIGAALGAAAAGAGAVFIGAPTAVAAEASAVVSGSVGAGASASGAIEVVIAYDTGAVVGTQSTIVVPGAIAAQITGSAGAATAYQAMLAAPAVKAVAAAAGALLLLGNVRNAQASTGSAAAASLENVMAVRAIPLTDFQAVGGIQQAPVRLPKQDVCMTPQALEKNFGLGVKVLYDNNPHWIIGRVRVD
jgi:hypothetical protein